MAKEEKLVSCRGCGYEGRVLLRHSGYKWWMLPVGLVLAITGIGLIPLAVILTVIGNRTEPACPGCSSPHTLADWSGQPEADAESRWQAAFEADDLLLRRSKRIVLAIVLVVLAAALMLAYRTLG